MNVNGEARSFAVEPRSILLDALRNELGLTGPKKSCDSGECGACTVHIDGRRVLSCMTLAAMHDGQQIATIEGSNGINNSIQSSRRSSRTTDSNVVSVHPDKSCRRSP